MSHAALIGKRAPSISLPNYTGEMYSLTPGDSGIPTVLFFYPNSGSYGCTREACRSRDAIAGELTIPWTKDRSLEFPIERGVFQPGKVQIIGLSPDPVDKQKRFVEKEKLTYPVLSDVNGDAAKSYGIGKGLMGLAPIARVTVVIDKKGIVRDTLGATVNYGAHSKFVAKWLDKLEVENAASVDPPKADPTPPSVAE